MGFETEFEQAAKSTTPSRRMVHEEEKPAVTSRSVASRAVRRESRQMMGRSEEIDWDTPAYQRRGSK